MLYLYDAWSYKVPLLPPFEMEGTDLYYKGQKCTPTTAPNSSNVLLHPPTVKAICQYANVMIAEERGRNNGIYPDVGFAAGMKDDNLIVEIYDRNHQQLTGIVYEPNNDGVMAGSIIDLATNTNIFNCKFYSYQIGPGQRNGTEIILALLPMLFKKANCRTAFEGFYSIYKSDIINGTITQDNLNLMAEQLCLLSRSIQEELNDDSKGIPLKLLNENQLRRITSRSVEQGIYNPDNIMTGEFRFFSQGKTTVARKPVETSKFEGKYRLSDRTFSNEEQKLIPHMPDFYVVPDEIVNVCEHIKGTHDTAYPFKNIMLRGPAGTGKTMGAQAIAAGLSLPYLYYTCSANTEIFDFIGQIIPDMDDGKNDDATILSGAEIAKKLNIPEYMSIRNMPEDAYEKITGLTKVDASVEDCLFAAFQKIGSFVKDKTSSQRFRYVETPLIKAIRNGYLCEIQEPTVILQPGVLVGLNGLLDPDGQIFLPTGETLARHPETIIVTTTNVDYEGCRNMNQAFISRHQLVMDMMMPQKDIIIKRVMKQTGSTDSKLVGNMVDVIEDVTKTCQEKMIDDGVVGFRELIAWVISTEKVTHNAFQSAIETIIPKATADIEEQKMLIDSCIAPKFPS